jgi:hypothetical protein
MLVRPEVCSEMLVSNEMSIDCTSHRAAASPAPCDHLRGGVLHYQE